MSEYLDLTEPQGDPVETPETEVAAEEPAGEQPAETAETQTEEAPSAETEEKKRIPGSQRQKERALRLQMELEQTREQLAAIQRQMQATQTPAGSLKEPDISEYDSVREYAEAYGEYVAAQRVAEAEYRMLEQRARDANRIQAEQAQKANAEFDAKVKAEAGSEELARDVVTEFQYYAAMGRQTNPAVVDAVGNAIWESEAGPALVVALGKDPELMERLISMPPHRALAELGKLEDKILATKAKPTKPTSSAPKPPEPVRAVPAAKPAKGSDGITLY